MLAIVLASVGAASAGPYEDAEAAYERKDYALAMVRLKPLVDQGDARAQTMLGLIYTMGLGTPKNHAKAIELFRQAAEQGHSHAQFTLGSMYLNGNGVPQDFLLAHMWYSIAEAKGHGLAPQFLARTGQELTIEQIAEAQNKALVWLGQHQHQAYSVAASPGGAIQSLIDQPANRFDIGMIALNRSLLMKTLFGPSPEGFVVTASYVRESGTIKITLMRALTSSDKSDFDDAEARCAQAIAWLRKAYGVDPETGKRDTKSDLSGLASSFIDARQDFEAQVPQLAGLEQTFEIHCNIHNLNRLFLAVAPFIGNSYEVAIPAIPF